MLDHPLFRGIDPVRLLSILGIARVRMYRTGELVVGPASDPAGLRLVLSGCLCLFDLTTDGRRLVFEYSEAGDFDGLLAVHGLRGHFSEAIKASRVLALSRDLLDRIIVAEPQAGSNLTLMLVRRLQRREDQVRWMYLRNPSQRLAGHLLALAESIATRRGDFWLAPRISHEALADMLGLRRETVSLHMGQLIRTGAVRVEKRHFVLHRDRLEALRDGRHHLDEPPLADAPIRSRLAITG